jgi:hypothetical protein
MVGGVEPVMVRQGSRPAYAALAVAAALALAGCHGGDSAWWGLRSELASDTTVVPITVRIGSSSCHRFDGVTVAETDESVKITASVSSLGRRDCTADLRFRAVDVRLARPLGDRELEGCAHVDRRPCDEVTPGQPS